MSNPLRQNDLNLNYGVLMNKLIQLLSVLILPAFFFACSETVTSANSVTIETKSPNINSVDPSLFLDGGQTRAG